MGKAFDIGLSELAGVRVGTDGEGDQRAATSDQEENSRSLASPAFGAQAQDDKNKVKGAGITASAARGTFYLETFGCQMNEHDSEKVAGVLLARGYRQVEKADSADVILYNTCSIREKAAQKLFSRLGEWRPQQGGQRPFGAQGRAATDDRRRRGNQGSSPQSEVGTSGDREEETRTLRSCGTQEQSSQSSVESSQCQKEQTQDPPSTSEGGAPAEHEKPAPLQTTHRSSGQGGSGIHGQEEAISEGLKPGSQEFVMSDLKSRPTVRREKTPIIGVLGCVAQQEKEKIFERAPWVSLVCGSASYRKLPQLIQELEQGNRRVTGLDTDTDETFETEITRRDNPWRAYLTIIEGCDKACSYCVVPFTRGPERSRTSESILAEVRQLADMGYREVQLLGQTVNSYADPSLRRMRFSELLVAVAEVQGIRRVRFTTSHPRDFGKDIVEAIDAVPGICEHVHLPVQSGSSRVLKAMARTYSREEYLEKVALMRAAKREISITTDVIVGFPGETEKDFEETLSLMDAVQYDGAFCFKYSPRPNTPSLKMEDAIPEEEKSRRLGILLEKQREIQRARNEQLLGKTLEVMVEGKSRRENQWSGHTSANKVMNFASQRQESLGDYVRVKVIEALPNSLIGEVTSD